jgi:hypothetical protein
MSFAPSPHRPVAPSTRLSLLLIFIDGLGIGTRGDHNPLDRLGSPYLSFFKDEESALPFGGQLAITDARLGVEGLPQSATGQTTILTGENGAKAIGRHLNGYPTPTLRKLLSEKSIYKQLLAGNRTATFANAYTPGYFENRPRFVSATTVAAEAAGLRLRTLEDLEKGEAVFHDFTNRSLIERGFAMPVCSPEQGGRNLVDLSAGYDFTLYEHFITDRIGHNRDYEGALEHLTLLHRFVSSVLEHADLERQTVVLVSDHGNIEDMRTRSHTLNPIATLAFGRRAAEFVQTVGSLIDIAPRSVDLLTETGSPEFGQTPGDSRD